MVCLLMSQSSAIFLCYVKSIYTETLTDPYLRLLDGDQNVLVLSPHLPRVFEIHSYSLDLGNGCCCSLLFIVYIHSYIHYNILSILIFICFRLLGFCLAYKKKTKKRDKVNVFLQYAWHLIK